jgi:hypothetical protein
MSFKEVILPVPGKYNSKYVCDVNEAILSGREEGFDVAFKDSDDVNHIYIYYKPPYGFYKGLDLVFEMILNKKNGGELRSYEMAGFEYHYPITFPYVRCITPIFHPNISAETGNICVDILKSLNAWKSAITISAVMRCILVLFDTPNPDSSYNDTAGRLYVKCEKEYKQMIAGDASRYSIHELDQFRDAAFANYIKEVKRQPRFDVRSYAKYFPQLRGETHPESYYEEARQIYEKLKPKKMVDEDSKEEETPEEKKKRLMAKFAKKK